MRRRVRAFLSEADTGSHSNQVYADCVDLSAVENASNKNPAWRPPPRGFVIDASEGTAMSGIIWIIVVGFIAGIIARMLSPGPNNPSGFILTTVLGIAGAFLETW